MANTDTSEGFPLLGVLTGLASQGLGGVLSSLGDELGLSLFGGGRSAQMLDAAESGLQAGIKYGPQLTQAGMYSAAGTTGNNVPVKFGQALDSLRNSASAINTANKQNALGDKAISSLGTKYTIAKDQNQMAMGDLRRDAMSTLHAQGAGPSALSAALAKIGTAQNRGSLEMLNQTAGQTAPALATALSGYGSAQDTLGRDLMQRNAIYVDPYKANVNPGISGLGGSMAQAGLTGATSAISSNPFAGLASYMGNYGTGSLMQLFNRDAFRNQLQGGQNYSQ